MSTIQQVRLLGLLLPAQGNSTYLLGTQRGFRYISSSDYYTPPNFLRFINQTQVPPNGETTETVLVDLGGGDIEDAVMDISPSGIVTVSAGTGIVTVPDLNRQALLYGVTPDNFPPTQKLTLEILTSTTARWKFEERPWYEFTIAKTFVIDPASGLAFAFMTTTGFGVGDVWTWEAQTPPYTTDYGSEETALAQPCGFATFKSDAYIYGYNRQILRLRDDIVTSVGYNPVFGKSCIVFYNHLVVSQYAIGMMFDGVMTDSYDSSITPWRLAWSHLNDPDQFYPTDLNEADQYDIPSNSPLNRFTPGITGLAILNDILIIYLANSIYTMRYVGLPNVMQIDMFTDSIGSIFIGGLVATPLGHFFIGQDNIYRFNGAQPERIGFAVISQFFAEVGSPETNLRWYWTYAYYDSDNAEVIWTYWVKDTAQPRQLIFQTNWNRYYFRNVPADIRAMAPDAQREFGASLYGGTGVVLQEFQTGDSLTDLVADDVVTGKVTEPLAETPDLLYNDLFYTKEHSSMCLDASYTTGIGIQVEHNARKFTSETVTFNILPKVWTPNLPERLLSFPRKDGHVFRYRYTFKGDPEVENSPILGAQLYGYVDMIYRGGAEK